VVRAPADGSGTTVAGMGNGAQRRWRRRGWRAFRDALPVLLGRGRAVALAVVVLVAAVAGGVLLPVWWGPEAPVATTAAGALTGVAVVLLVASVVTTVDGVRAGRGLPRVRVLDENVLWNALGEDDVVTADAATVPKIEKQIARVRAVAPRQVLAALLLAAVLLAVVTASALLLLRPSSWAWLLFSVVSVGATTWAVCDGFGRAETAAAAIDEGRVVAPAPEVPRWLRNLPRRGGGGASGPDEP